MSSMDLATRAEQTDPRIVEAARSQFPALQRQGQERTVCYFDGPAGTQVPQRVVDAIGDYLLHHNANSHGVFPTSVETDELIDRARRKLAVFLQVDAPDQIAFGPNMTSLTMAFSRALSRTWRDGDELIVTQLDHDANVAPWLLAARDVGAVVHRVPLDPSSCTLRIDELERLLNPRTRLVAVGIASNAVGTINPVAEICQAAHQVGAMVFADAVHWAPHGRIDLAALPVDVLVCSAYKFFGPHLGILWGRRPVLERVQPYKVRPAPDTIPDCWMTGTLAFESVAGTAAAVEYLEWLGERVAAASTQQAGAAAGSEPTGRASGIADAHISSSQSLDHAFRWIRQYELQLFKRLIDGIAELKSINVIGLPKGTDLALRAPTISIRHAARNATQLARDLAARDVFTWNGNYYAYEWSHAMNLPPDGAVRIGLLHYNTVEEVDHLLSSLRDIDS